MLVCGNCGSIIAGNNEGYLFCRSCNKITYFMSFKFK